MRALLILISAVVMYGCTGTSGIEAVSIGTIAPSGEVTYTTDVVVGSRVLARRVAVSTIDQREIGGLLQASVSIKSMTRDTEALQYRWTWFDARGFEVNSSSQSWQPLMVYGGQTTSVQGLAPNGSAKSYKLHLRYQE